MTIFQEWCGNLPPEEACQILLEHPLTDAGNAESFKTLFGERFCYVPQVGKWFKYDGVRSAANGGDALLSMLEAVRIKGKKIAMSLRKGLKRGMMIIVPPSLRRTPP